MSFGDELGAVDPQGIVTGLIAEQSPELVQGGGVDPQTVLNRIIRKGLDQRAQEKLKKSQQPPQAQQPAADFSAFGKTEEELTKEPSKDPAQPPEPAADFAAFGQEEPEDIGPPMPPPGELKGAEPKGVLGTVQSALDMSPTGAVMKAGKAAVDFGTRAYDDFQNAPPAKKAEPSKPDDPWAFKQGLVGGTIGQNPKMAGRATEALGHIIGNENIIKKGEELAGWGDEKLKSYEPRVGSITNIRTDSVGNFLEDVGSYAGYSAGQGIGSSIPSLAGGAIGGGVGALAGPGGARAGMLVGASLPSFVQNWGDVYGSAIEDKDIAKRIADGQLTKRGVAGATVAAGAVMAALDVVSLDQVVGKAITRPIREDLLKRIISGIGKGAIVEGSTEGLQEVISQWAQDQLGSKKGAYEKFIAVVDNAFGGMFAGAGFGGFSNLRGGQQQQPGAGLGLPGAAPSAGANAGTPPPGGPIPGADAGEQQQQQPPPGAPPPPGAQPGAQPPPGGTPPGPPPPPFESELKPNVRSTLNEKAAYYKEHSPADIAAWSDDQVKEYVATKGGLGAHADNQPNGTRDQPIDIKSAADIARATEAVNEDHSHEQGEANNIQRGHARWEGLGVTFETGRNNLRRGINPETGERWEANMGAPYGYFTGLPAGADGQHPDAFFGEHPSAPTVFVLDELDKGSGDFRQTKSFIGFRSPFDALDAYVNSTGKSRDHISGMRAFTVDEFKALAKSGGLSKPVSDAHEKRAAQPKAQPATEKPAAEAPAPATAPTEQQDNLAEDNPSAEPLSDIKAQVADLNNDSHPRAAVYLPPTTVEHLSQLGLTDEAIAGRPVIEDFDGKGGVLIARDEATAAKAVKDRDGGVNIQKIVGALTGAGDGKPADGSHGVQQIDKAGNVTRERFVREADIAATQKEFAHPGRSVRVLPPEEVIARRAGMVEAERNQPKAGPEHVSAIEAALKGSGFDKSHVDPADIARAAEIHAQEGAPPDQAFAVATVRRLVEDGHISRADVEKELGHEQASQLMGTGDGAGRDGVAPAQAPGAATGGKDPARPAKLDAGGAQPGAQVRPGTEEQKQAIEAGAAAHEGAAGAAGAAPGRRDIDEPAGGKRDAAADGGQRQQQAAPPRKIEPPEGYEIKRSTWAGGERWSVRDPDGHAIPGWFKSRDEAIVGANTAAEIAAAKDLEEQRDYLNDALDEAHIPRDIIDPAVEARALTIMAGENYQGHPLDALEAALIQIERENNDVPEQMLLALDVQQEAIDAIDELTPPQDRQGAAPAGGDEGQGRQPDEKERQPAPRAGAGAGRGSEPGAGENGGAAAEPEPERKPAAAEPAAKPERATGERAGVANEARETGPSDSAAKAPEKPKRTPMDRETFSAALEDRDSSAIGPDGATYDLVPLTTGQTMPMRWAPPKLEQERLKRLAASTREQAHQNLLNHLYGREPAAKPKSPWTEIGKNDQGRTLFEDARGVRSYVENGVRLTEPVPMRPTRAGGVETPTPIHRDEWVLASEKPAKPLAESPAASQIPGEEPSDGVSPTLRPGDARTGPGDVQTPLPDEGDRPLRGDEDARSEPDVRRADEGRPETGERVPGGAVRPGGRGESAGRPDPVSGGPERADGRGEGAAEPDADHRAEQQAEERPDDSVVGENYRIEPGALDETRSQKRKALDNVAAIELSRRLEADGKPATHAEQQILARYVGWGGIKGAFPDANGQFANGLEGVGEKLKELLPAEEYKTAQRSIQYAHYTAEKVVRAMWRAVQRLNGGSGGVVFEPGMGIGNFAGMIPTDAHYHYEGLEFDATTARIAKLLYPKFGVRHADFTRSPLPENAFDLVIGNPPFADVVIKSDKKYAKLNLYLHDYFFAKSLDGVRPGGLLAFISSAGTMNKIDPSAREYLADRAELVGAIRLPSDAFKANAGTEVTTDIVFLRKRFPGEAAGDRTWTETVEVKLPNKTGKIISGAMNRYFAEHPEMVLGEQGFFDKLYEDRYAVHARPGQNFAADLEAAIARLPENVTIASDKATEFAPNDFESTEKKDGGYYIGPKDELYQFRNGRGVPVARRGAGVEGGMTAAAIERIKGLIPIRDAVREVFAANLKDNAEKGDAARKKLNTVYDAFVAKFGPINKADLQYRRPTSVQAEGARAEAREEARYAGERFNEGSFDPGSLIRQGKSLTEIARVRRTFQEEAEAKGQPWDEGDFDPADMPDVVIDRRPNIDPFMDDPESYRLRAIEKYDDAKFQAEKSDVFLKNTITRDKPPDISSINDALLYTLNQKGRVDIPEIARLAKKSEAEAIEALGTAIFREPGTIGAYVTRDEYLSGNVREKLLTARAEAEKNAEFRRNVEALEAAQPTPLAPSQITASLGMPWIPEATIEEFARDELGLERFKAKYIPSLAQWVVQGDQTSAAAVSTWGTDRRPAPALIEDALNRRQIKVFDRIFDEGREKSVLNLEATQAANDKAETLKQKFLDWIWADPERAERLAGLYNDNYNNLVVREYDGTYLTTPGVSTHWSWRPHQKRVIARIIQSGNTYVAHAVGGGKTSEMIGAGMEMRRLGLVRKPMYAVPNHMLAQFTKEFYEQYPTAKIAVADERRFHTDRRKQFIANVANEDLDAIIITHSAFGMIPISNEFADGVVEEELDHYRELMEQVKGDRITRSRIEKQIERLEQRLSGRNEARKDQVITFEEMGVDFLFVDEAHMFRKLDFSTQMGSMKGITPEGSQMAWDLYIKTLYLETVNPGRNLVLASGTPVTNTMAELFTVSRYLQRNELQNRGLGQFDAWASAFGEPVTELEQDAAGGYKPVSRFSRFVNVAELSSMVRQVMDVVTSKQLGEFVVRPTLMGGKRELRLAEKSPALVRYQNRLAERMKAIQARKGPPKKGDDIMLSVINDGRHAAIDMRLVGAKEDKNSKLSMLVDDVYQTWKETKRTKFYGVKDGAYDLSKPKDIGPATQMVFANLGLSGVRGFSVPDFIRAELVRRGVPKNEIAYIYDYKTHVQKQRLFNDMNEGKVRILIGSTAKMATGVNAQRRIVAINNLDPLWFPSDDEQRNGRGIRQGNMNPEIKIRDYATKGTYDSTMWGMMERKARFIQMFFEGDGSLRDMEDLGEASQYEQAKAITTNDPRLIELTELKQQLQKARRRWGAFDQELHALKARRAEAKREIERQTKRAEDLATDIKQREDISGDKFTGKIGKKTYTQRVEFGDAMMEAMDKLAEKANNGKVFTIGTIGGFPLLTQVRSASGGGYGTIAELKLTGGERSLNVGVSAIGAVRSIEATLVSLESNREEALAKVKASEKFIAQSEEGAKATFTGQAEIDALTKKVQELSTELSKAATAEVHPVETDPATITNLNQLRGFGFTNELEQFRERRAAERAKLPGEPGDDIERYGFAQEVPDFAPDKATAFKRWFGDSKVVDGDGKPLVVYHGRASHFSTFRDSDGWYGRGIYFTDNAEYASEFAQEATPTSRSHANVVPVYLSLQRPFFFNDEINDLASNVQLMKAIGLDDAAIERSFEGNRSGSLIRRTLENAGHDGIIVTSIEGRNEYIAFRPTQIKSATGNSGAFDPHNPSMLAQEVPDFAEREANPPRRHGIPASARTPLAEFTSDSKLKAHPDYKAAKAGDVLAAGRLVRAMVGEQSLTEAAQRFGANVVYVPVVAQEQTGPNKIPNALAELYATSTGAVQDENIVQANRAFHTGAGPMERLANRAMFEGPVTPGARYVLVDDVSVMGSTLADLADHITRGGGEVAGVALLVNASRSTILTPTRGVVRDVERRFGDVVRELFHIEPAGLTADEAQYLRNFRDADALRAGRAKAEQQRRQRLAAKGISDEIEPPGEGGFAEDEGAYRAPVFYSAVARAIENSKQEKASPNHWLGTLKNAQGVKPEEMQWLGLEEWLRQHQGPVTKQALADYVRANQIEVKEVEKGGPDTATADERIALREELDQLEREGQLGDPNAEIQGSAAELFDGVMRGDSRFIGDVEGLGVPDDIIAPFRDRERTPTKFGQWVLPGGENYRELLLTLPPKLEGAVGLTMNDIANRLGYGGWTSSLTPEQVAHVEGMFEAQKIGPIAFNKRIETIDGQIEVLRRQMPGNRDDADLRRIRNEITALDNERGMLLAEKEKTRKDQFTSSHWHEPNVLAHVRFNTRYTSADGTSYTPPQKVLFIEEIQSDWHQKGKKVGYDDPQARAAVEKKLNDAGYPVSGEDARLAASNGIITDAEAKLLSGRNYVPDAPFKTTWPELAMKRMIRYAAENGYDKIAWTPGDVQAARYDLSKQIDSIVYQTTDDGHYEVRADKDGRTIFQDDHLSEAKLEDTFGKDVAAKIVAGDGQRTAWHDYPGAPKDHKKLEGLDLKVGGEGMAGFYDKMLPAMVNKLVRKYGARVAARDMRSETGGPWGVFDGADIIQTFPSRERAEAFIEDARANEMDPLDQLEVMEPPEGAGERSIKVHTVEITPELKDAAVRQGFTLFQGEDGIKAPPPAAPAAGFTPREGEPIAREAQDYVLAQGRATGNEHLVAIDGAGKVFLTRQGSANHVQLSADEMTVLNDPANQIVVHHNHPSETGLSTVDISMLGSPGLAAIWAHGHGGNVARMALTPKARALFAASGTPAQVRRALSRVANAIHRSIYDTVQQAVLDERVSMDGALLVQPHVIGLALARAGIVDYRSNTDVDHIIESLGLEAHIQRAVQAAAGAFNGAALRDDRPAKPLGHPGDVGATFERVAPSAGRDREQGRPDRAGEGLDREEEGGGDGVLDVSGFAAPRTRFRRPNPHAPPNRYPVAETIAGLLEMRNYPKLAAISSALRLGRANVIEARARLQDKFIRIKQAEAAVTRDAGPIPESMQTYLAESLYYGRTGERLEQLDKQHIDPLIADIKARNLSLEDVDRFLMARHAPERNARLRLINPSIADPSGMSDAQARAILDAIGPNRRGDYDAIERRVRALIDATRDDLVRSGLISQDSADIWQATYANYVPLRGWAEGLNDPSVGTGRGFDIRGQESKQALGRKSVADSPLAYTLMQAQSAVVRGEKNKVAQTALRFVRNYPNDGVWKVDKGDGKRVIDAETGLVKDVIDPMWTTRDNVFAVKVKGVVHYINFQGEYGADLARALNNLGTANMGSVLRFFNMLTRTLARLSTSWNPDFMIPNFVRDVGEAFINMQEQQQRSFVRRFLRHLLPSLGGSWNALAGGTGGRYAQAFRDFDKAGGRIRFFGLDNADDIKSAIASKMRRLQGGPINNIRAFGEKALEYIEIANGGIENATRLAAFMAARDVGLTDAKAASIAREMTVNFNRRGEYGQVITSLYMFANAAGQGGVRMVQAMGTSARVRRFAYGLAGLAASLAFYNIGAGGDDDDGVPHYLKIAPWERDNNLILMWPKGYGHDGQYIKLPLPYGYAFFAVIGARSAALSLGKEKKGKAFSAMAKAVFDAFDPLGKDENMLAQVLPTLARPAAHLGMNKSWTGRNINPQAEPWNKNDPNSTRTFRSASDFAKNAARDLNAWTGGTKREPGLIDISPGTIDYMLGFVGGGLGRFGQNMVDLIVRGAQGQEWLINKTPIVHRFYGEKNEQGDRALFFEARDEVKAAHDRAQGYRRDRDGGNLTQYNAGHAAELSAYSKFDSVDKARRVIYAEIEKIKKDASLSAAEKDAKVKAQEQRELALMAQARKQLEDARARRVAQ